MFDITFSDSVGGQPTGLVMGITSPYDTGSDPLACYTNMLRVLVLITPSSLQLVSLTAELLQAWLAS